MTTSMSAPGRCLPAPADPVLTTASRGLRRLAPYLRMSVGVGIMAVLMWRLGSDAFLDGFRVIGVGSVAAALAIGLLTTVCCAARWCLVARGVGLRLPLRTAIGDYYRALMLNALLPTGVLGDVHRAVRHGRGCGDVGRGVRAVVLERSAGQVVLLVVGAAVLLGRPDLISAVAGALLPSGLLLLALLAVTAVAGWAVLRRGRLPARLRRAAVHTWADLRSGLAGRDVWPGVLLLSAVALAGHVTLFVIAARVAGSTAPVSTLVPLLILALLAMGLPVNVGGWGPREAVSALAFGAAGLGAGQGLTIAVVYGVLTLVSCLPGVAVPVRPRPASPAGPVAVSVGADRIEPPIEHGKVVAE